VLVQDLTIQDAAEDWKEVEEQRQADWLEEPEGHSEVELRKRVAQESAQEGTPEGKRLIPPEDVVV